MFEKRHMKDFLGIALSIGLLGGCNTQVDASARPLFSNGVNYLTVFAYDGLTGARIADARLTVQLGPDTIEARTEAEGIYTIAQVPRGSYPIFAEAEGYLPFTGLFTFSGRGRLSDPDDRTNYTRLLIMYPKQGVEEDIEIRVFDNADGSPIAQGQVVAAFDGDAVDSIIDDGAGGGDVLSPNLGYRPQVITAQINSDGRAVLPKDQLVLGATYNLNVYQARNADGDYLIPTDANAFTAGEEIPKQTIFVERPSGPPIAVSANNEGSNVLVDELVVTFAHPVAVCSDPREHTWTANAPDTDGDSNTTQVADDNPVEIEFDDTSTIMTVTYNAESEDADDALTVTFSSIKVQLQGTSSCVDLGDVSLRDSTDDVNMSIQVRDPQG